MPLIRLHLSFLVQHWRHIMTAIGTRHSSDVVVDDACWKGRRESRRMGGVSMSLSCVCTRDLCVFQRLRGEHAVTDGDREGKDVQDVDRHAHRVRMSRGAMDTRAMMRGLFVHTCSRFVDSCGAWRVDPISFHICGHIPMVISPFSPSVPPPMTISD